VEKLPFATDAAASPSPAHPIPVTSIYISVLHASIDEELAAIRVGKPKEALLEREIRKNELRETFRKGRE